MWIPKRYLARYFRPHVGGPAARKAQEEPLFRSEAVDIHPRLSFHCFLESGISDHQSAEVGDRLALHQRTVLVQAFFDLKGIKLIDDASGTFVECLEVLLAPPVREVSRRIVL